MITPSVFISQVWDELKKVTWPTRQEVIRLTFAVILISLIVGAYIGGLDYLFTKVLTIAINK